MSPTIFASNWNQREQEEQVMSSDKDSVAPERVWLQRHESGQHFYYEWSSPQKGVEYIRADLTQPSAPEELIALLGETEEQLNECFPHSVHYDATNENPTVCQECNGAIDDHKANCFVPSLFVIAAELRKRLVPSPECAYCDSKSLAICAECFKKPQDRAKARSEECARLIVERDSAHSRAAGMEKAALSALEWHAGFPHQGTASHFDLITSGEVYEELSHALSHALSLKDAGESSGDTK